MFLLTNQVLRFSIFIVFLCHSIDCAFLGARARCVISGGFHTVLVVAVAVAVAIVVDFAAPLLTMQND